MTPAELKLDQRAKFSLLINFGYHFSEVHVPVYDNNI